MEMPIVSRSSPGRNTRRASLGALSLAGIRSKKVGSGPMFRFLGWVALWLIVVSPACAGYLDENPDEVFATVYERLGAIPVAAARDPFVWLRLQELKREPCDQKSIDDLALALDKNGYRRQAADGLFRFVL